MLSSDLTEAVGFSAAVQHRSLRFPGISITGLKPRREHGAAITFNRIGL